MDPVIGLKAPITARQRVGRSARALLLTLGLIAALWLIVVLLPHDRYLRYQAAAEPPLPKTHWLYERIHFDPLPIDVAFFGGTRTGYGIDSEAVELVLAERGRARRVVNFSLPGAGRDVQYVLIEELLANREVEAIIVEITDTPTPLTPARAFQLADRWDTLTAPLVEAEDRLYTLIALPIRQLRLFVHDVAVRFGLRQSGFAYPTDYFGAHYNTTRSEVAPDGRIALNRNRLGTRAVLEEVLAPRWQQATPAPVAAQRVAHMFERRILDLAQREGTAVILYHAPRFAGPADPSLDGPFAAADLPLINGRDLVAEDYRYWQSVVAPLWRGALRLSSHAGDNLAAVLDAAPRHPPDALREQSKRRAAQPGDAGV